jgi:hypothetical protein
MTTKSFATAGPILVNTSDGTILGTQAYAGTSGTLETYSHDLSRLGKGDVGGPFNLSKTEYTYNIGKHVLKNAQNTVVRQLFPSIPNIVTQDSDLSARSNLDMNSLGSTLLSQQDPTEPVFSAATALGELRADGLPSLPGISTWRSRTLSAKNAGGEYLNVEFGWKPLISDLRKFAFAVDNADKIIGDYRKRANTKHHFQGGDASAVILDTKVFNGAVSHWTGQGLLSYSSTPATAYSVTSKREWVEGVYKYYLPMGNDRLSKMRRYASYARKLYGIELTPEVLWNLAPWSWAADWFGNVGDVMHNVSAFGRDSFALQYCYVMSEKTYVREVKSQYGSFKIVGSRKQRLPASPFGFGFALSSLTKRQSAILVALGMSHDGIPKRF